MFLSIVVRVQDKHNNILFIWVPITVGMFSLVVLCILQECSSV